MKQFAKDDFWFYNHNEYIPVYNLQVYILIGIFNPRKIHSTAYHSPMNLTM